MNLASSGVYFLEREAIGVHSGRRNSYKRDGSSLAAATDSCWGFKGAIVRASSGPFITKVTDECSLRNSWPTIHIGAKVLDNTESRVWEVRLWKESVAITMPQVGIDTSEDAMAIEVGDPLIAKCNFWQILKSTKFSEAPESTKIRTGKSASKIRFFDR